MLSYAGAFRKAQERPWSLQDEEGSIICSVAENKLNSQMLHVRTTMRKVFFQIPLPMICRGIYANTHSALQMVLPGCNLCCGLPLCASASQPCLSGAPWSADALLVSMS